MRVRTCVKNVLKLALCFRLCPFQLCASLGLWNSMTVILNKSDTTKKAQQVNDSKRVEELAGGSQHETILILLYYAYI